MISVGNAVNGEDLVSAKVEVTGEFICGKAGDVSEEFDKVNLRDPSMRTRVSIIMSTQLATSGTQALRDLLDMDLVSVMISRGRPVETLVHFRRHFDRTRRRFHKSPRCCLLDITLKVNGFSGVTQIVKATDV